MVFLRPLPRAACTCLLLLGVLALVIGLAGGNAERAMVRRPSLLVCDEAVSSLDARHRADILAILSGRKKKHGLALLFITHHMSAAHARADRVVVMDQGQLVEVGDAGQVLSRPAHPTTRAMMAGRALWSP